MPYAMAPASASAGVRAMEATTTMISKLFSSEGSTPSWLASENTTKANSPPWPTSKPVRTDSARDRPTSGPAAVTIDVLMTIRPASKPSTLGHSRASSSVSMLVPVVTKNRPSSSPRKGRMSASTWLR